MEKKYINPNNPVYISYAWADDKHPNIEEDVENLCEILEANYIYYKRDKTNLCPYRWSIQKAEEEIGEGTAIIVVISERYLKSLHCMNEWHLMRENGKIWERVFPIVLESCKITDKNTFREIYKFFKSRADSLIEQQAEDIIPLTRAETEAANAGFYIGDLKKMYQYLADNNTSKLTELRKDNYEIIINQLKDFLKQITNDKANNKKTEIKDSKFNHKEGTDEHLPIKKGESLLHKEHLNKASEKVDYHGNRERKIIGKYPSESYFEIGKQYFAEKKYTGAKNSFEIAIEGNPNYVEAYQALAEVYIQLNNLKEAWKAIEYALHIKKDSCSLFETRCKVFLLMGMYVDAKKDVEKALKLAKKKGEIEHWGNLKKMQDEIIQKQNESNKDDDLKEIIVENYTIRMKKISGGAFTMGATDEDPEAYDDEKPTHRVLLDEYYIGETVVTQALWMKVMKTAPKSNGGWEDCYGRGGNYPVYRVSWKDCQDFIKKLNSKTGQKFRLPTEAEWEYAARGGNKSQSYKYSGSNEIDKVAWYWKNSGDILVKESDENWSYKKTMENNSKVHCVKSKQANELGLYDMSGNVWEWCQDELKEYFTTPLINCYTNKQQNKNKHICRGGSWISLGRLCRVSCRNSISNRDDVDVGFRLALDIVSGN